ncbi:hypothetical protein EJV47_16595 [Hymenobacter gummosus]|uniref:TonB C-terminal domain-containing protein n=1 Tax=Hymenobacter gummosus TaxID=1776032 RepID=A0A431U0Z0_9BACT|nr:energy transducer TonB [Hymenobacter gummosus]RTQ48591.1 hypothetical protein EJV47_16595 [Hymenobacter gummosus]
MSPADPHFSPQAPAAAHLPAAVLRQYAAGTLTPAERRRVENHTLDCALCADALEGYQQAEPQATSPASLAELRQRLHARVEAEPATAPRGGAWWMAAAAAVLLLAFVGLWQWQQPAQNTAVVRSRPAAAPATQPAPAAATAPAADSTLAPVASEAELSDVAAAPPAATSRPPADYAAAPTRSRTRRSPRRPVTVAANVATETAADAAAEELPAAGTGVAVEVAAAPPVAAPALAKPSPEPESKAKVAARTVEVAAAPGRAALVADSPATVAPAAAQPPLREESSKRKSELPPAPALAPFPNGGYPAFRTYLIREQKRPEGLPRTDGTVKLKFTVEADGSVHNIQVVRGLNEDLDAEAIRLVCEGPSWRPGIVGGRRAAQTVRLDVPFR